MQTNHQPVAGLYKYMQWYTRADSHKRLYVQNYICPTLLHKIYRNELLTTNPKFFKTSHSATSPYFSNRGLSLSDVVSEFRLPMKILIVIFALKKDRFNGLDQTGRQKCQKHVRSIQILIIIYDCLRSRLEATMFGNTCISIQNACSMSIQRYWCTQQRLYMCHAHSAWLLPDLALKKKGKRSSPLSKYL